MPPLIGLTTKFLKAKRPATAQKRLQQYYNAIFVISFVFAALRTLRAELIKPASTHQDYTAELEDAFVPESLFLIDWYLSSIISL
jgi:hypothetical protein